MEECSEASMYSSEEEFICPGPLYRVKMFVMGDVGCGKTSLVQSLIGPRPKLNDHPTDGVNIELWYPFKTSKQNEGLLERKLSGDERHLIIEIWDLTGRQVCQHAHQMYVTRESMFLLLYNKVDQTSCDSVLPLYDIIQQAAPGSPVLIAGTMSDKSPPDGNRTPLPSGQNILDAIRRSVDNGRFYLKREMDEMKLLTRETHTNRIESGNKTKKNESKVRGKDDTSVITRESERCDTMLTKFREIPGKVHDVSSVSGKGLDELKAAILKTALDPVHFPHLDRTIKPSTLALYDEILKLRERDFVLLTWDQFRQVSVQVSPAGGDDTLEQDTAFLQTIGGLLDLKLTNSVSNTSDRCDPTRFICVYPSVLANAVCCCLVDDDKKAFRFESSRFWPRDSGFKRPDPVVLSKVLDSIPREGLIRESLLPLLWQESNLFEDQVIHVIRVLSYLGLLVNYSTCKQYCEGLALPYYPHLSVNRCLYATLLNLLPNNRPQLNWTPKPFKGDIQVTMGYVFPTGLPTGVAKQLLAHIMYIGQDTSSYRHIWRHGVLQRIGEVIVCAEHSDAQFNLSCRVNADEPGQEDSAVQLLWVSIAPFMLSLHRFLSHWAGLYYKLVLMPLGQAFYNDEKVENEPMVCFIRCLAFWLVDKRYCFKDGEAEREINLQLLFPFRGCPALSCVKDWLTFVNSKRRLVIPTEEHNTIPEPTKNKPSGLKVNPLFLISKGSLKLKGRKKKSVEVKWNLEKTDDNMTQPVQKQAQPIINKDPTPTANHNTDQVSQGEITPKPVLENTKPESTAPMAPNEENVINVRRGLTEEEELREAMRLASGFVAAIMASAVAEYISTESDNNPSSREVVSAAQVTAARVTAEAARAAQTGDIDGAAKAVLAAVKAVESAIDTSISDDRHGHIRSKLCTIL